MEDYRALRIIPPKGPIATTFWNRHVKNACSISWPTKEYYEIILNEVDHGGNTNFAIFAGDRDGTA